jgi:hypothetical protein
MKPVDSRKRYYLTGGMPKRKADHRTRLLEAAEKTTYRYGFGNTAIADIAKEAGIPPGNVYYYFKTKTRSAAPLSTCALHASESFCKNSRRRPTPKSDCARSCKRKSRIERLAQRKDWRCLVADGVVHAVRRHSARLWHYRPADQHINVTSSKCILLSGSTAGGFLRPCLFVSTER